MSTKRGFASSMSFYSDGEENNIELFGEHIWHKNLLL